MDEYYGLPHGELKYRHYYLTNVPENTTKEDNLNIELPYPVFQCYNNVIDLEEYRQPFSANYKMNVRFDYYKKVHLASDIKSMQKSIKNGTIEKLPYYFAVVSSGIFDNIRDNARCYTSGALDCISINDRTVLVWSALKQPLHMVDVHNPNINCNMSMNNGGIIYAVKSADSNQKVMVALRQKFKISLCRITHNGDSIVNSFKWEANSGVAFHDMALNNFKKSEISTIDYNYKLRITDFKKNNIKSEIELNQSPNVTNDNFAQMDYIDENTLCCMNRTYLHFIDTRTSTVQKYCLKLNKIECDDLCTFSVNNNDKSLCVSSKHNIAKFDLRSMACVDRTSHFLESSPFVSSIISENDTEYVALMGEHYKDKVLLYNTENTFNTPKYVPNMLDSYKYSSLTTNLQYSQYIQNRLLLPCLGMKLHKDKISNKISLYTLNSVGDIFKQNLTQGEPSNNETSGIISSWIKSLPKRGTSFETTAVFDLSHYLNVASDYSYKKQNKLFADMSKDNSSTLYNQEFPNLTEQLDSYTGISMNSIWTFKTENKSDSDS